MLASSQPTDRPGFSASSATSTIVGLVAIVLTVVGEVLLSGRSLAAERPPDGSWPYLVRSGLLAGSSVLVALGSRGLVHNRTTARARSAVNTSATASPRATILFAVVGSSMAWLAALLLIVDPVTLSNLVREDRIVEWGSALLCFAAVALLIIAAIRYRRALLDGQGSRSGVAVLILLAGVFLLLGLEEISWFQRVIDVESPEAFVNRNGQQELNLHNFATMTTGNLYYVGAFVFCVFLPYLFHNRTLPPKLSWLDPLVPPIQVMYGSVLAGALVYEMWNVAWIQIIFWMSLAIALTTDSTRAGQRLGRPIAISMVFVGIVFLTMGETMIRTWDETEVRELLIPFGLFIYGLAAVERADTKETGPVHHQASISD